MCYLPWGLCQGSYAKQIHLLNVSDIVDDVMMLSYMHGSYK